MLLLLAMLQTFIDSSLSMFKFEKWFRSFFTNQFLATCCSYLEKVFTGFPKLSGSRNAIFKSVFLGRHPYVASVFRPISAER